MITVGDCLLVTCWWLLLALSGNAEMFEAFKQILYLDHRRRQSCINSFNSRGKQLPGLIQPLPLGTCLETKV